MNKHIPRDSYTQVEQQIHEDLQRNSRAFLYYDATLDVLQNDEQQTILCESCGIESLAEVDGQLLVAECEQCGEQLTQEVEQ